MITPEIEALIRAALDEDMPRGDVTSESLIPRNSVSRAVFVAKEGGVLAGMDVVRRILREIDRSVRFKPFLCDGKAFRTGDRLAEVNGRSVSLLKGERTALNFLQRLSGIATETRKFVLAVKGMKTKILDTRKTTPMMRTLEKYAVRMGGGRNHRLNLSDMVLIKDNHLQIVGSTTESVRRARARLKHRKKIEVEVTDFAGAREAVEAGADMIMLDNMPLNKMRSIIAWVAGRVPVEVSGRVTLARARKIASLGVDYISIGSLTHSPKAIDISLEFLE